jgi:hypothetical protein
VSWLLADQQRGDEQPTDVPRRFFSTLIARFPAAAVSASRLLARG